MCRPTRQPFRGRLIRPGEMSEEYAQLLHRGSGGSMYTRKAHATREAPDAWSGMINRTPARDRPGALGWRRGSQYRGSRVMPVEGRGLSSRQTQQVVRDREIGQPNNSETCSEAADGVTRESEGRSWLSLLCLVRQDEP